MEFSPLIVVANDELVEIPLDMHALRSLEGKFEGLFVFHSNGPCDRVPLEHIFINPSVQ